MLAGNVPIPVETWLINVFSLVRAGINVASSYKRNRFCIRGRMKILTFSFLCILISSCATTRHKLMNGTVALKIDDTTGIACIEKNSAKVGSKLRYMNNDCNRDRSPDSRGQQCKLVKAGEFEVTKILNEHYVEFKKLSGPNFQEGSIIESP